MTLSIVAKEEKSGDYGVCGFTDIANYGSLVPFVSLNGAVATQAYVNVDNGINFIESLDSNSDISNLGNKIINKDCDKNMRQMIAINNKSYFEWTGKDIIDWKGSIIGDNFVISGNCMKNKTVLEAAASYFLKNKKQDFSLRLIKSIQAGERAGGHINIVNYYDQESKKYIKKTTTDIFGNMMSAAVIIASLKPKLWHNLRVDAHPKAIFKIENIYFDVKDSAEKLNKFYNGAITVKPFYWRKIK